MGHLVDDGVSISFGCAKMNIEDYRNQKPLYVYVLILITITVINSLLSRFAVISWQIAPGVSGLYFAVAFMVAFALWFGIWGAIAAYAGCFIGAGIATGLPLSVNAYWSLADFWQVFIPLAAFKASGADAGLKTKKDFVIFLVSCVVFNNLAGAGWGAGSLALGGIIPWNDVPTVFEGWLVSNLIVTIVITPLLLRFITPHIEKFGVYVGNHWI